MYDIWSVNVVVENDRERERERDKEKKVELPLVQSPWPFSPRYNIHDCNSLFSRYLELSLSCFSRHYEGEISPVTRVSGNGYWEQLERKSIATRCDVLISGRSCFPRRIVAITIEVWQEKRQMRPYETKIWSTNFYLVSLDVRQTQAANRNISELHFFLYCSRQRPLWPDNWKRSISVP